MEKLAIPTLDGLEFFKLDDIVYCEAGGNYTTLFMINNTKKVVSKSLKEFEMVLNDSGFYRVHHSFLINLGHIQKYIKGDGGYVILNNNYHVDISRRKKDEFLKLMDKM